MVNRRAFVAAASSTAGSIFFGHDTQIKQLPLSRVSSTSTVSALIPESLTPCALRTLAAAAIDAARAAGASYADVRVAEQKILHIVGTSGGTIPIAIALFPKFTYGVRVFVSGTWAFRYGATASTDAITTSAREAVATASGYARISTQPEEIVSFPAITGEWETPCVLDPFTVPIADQCALAGAYTSAVARVHNGYPSPTTFEWSHETRVYMSTDGTCLTQTLRRSVCEVTAGVALPFMAKISVPMLPPRSGGYECITMPTIQEDIKRQTEELEPLLWLPHRTLEVGRYPVVMDGGSVGLTFIRTLGRASELDRVVGYELGGSGGSYLNPPSETLGHIVAAPLLTVTAHRNLPTVMAAKWDDDGVETREFPLVEEGRFRSYAMSRRTAPFLWKVLGKKTLSNGCAIASQADEPVAVGVPHVTIACSHTRMSSQELFQGIQHGVYVHYSAASFVSIDPLLTSGLVNPSTVMFEIRNGKLVSRLRGNGIQFSTPRLWKSLDAIGDVSTMRSASQSGSKGIPSTSLLYTADAPSARFREIDVINTHTRL